MTALKALAKIYKNLGIEYYHHGVKETTFGEIDDIDYIFKLNQFVGIAVMNTLIILDRNTAEDIIVYASKKSLNKMRYISLLNEDQIDFLLELVCYYGDIKKFIEIVKQEVKFSPKNNEIVFQPEAAERVYDLLLDNITF